MINWFLIPDVWYKIDDVKRELKKIDVTGWEHLGSKIGHPILLWMSQVEIRSLFLLPILFLCALGAKQDREIDWWETTIFYQIYPRSFMDSDGDGIGDLNGITSKLEYLKELGVGATWLSPMFQSPMYDFGYDISDFYAINDEYGTMEDFDKLMSKANELDIKIVLDFVPNHGSNESVWFEEALKGNEKYYDYFMWDDGVVDENGTLHPPNNWNSVFRKSAWEYREEVGKYYLHQFAIGQPDINYRNPEVVEEMKNVLRFWLDKGVAGFRVDAVAHLFEVDKEKFGGKYPDEPLSGNNVDDPESHNYLSHIYTIDQEETYEMVYQWREVFDEYKDKDGMTRVMMTEVYASPEITMRYYGDGVREGAQMPFNFNLITDVDGTSSAAEIKYALDKFLTFKPVDKLANWVAGNHDNNRVASRFGPELVDGVNMLVLLLPGVAVTYMGEEIGMVDGYISWEETVDPRGCNTDDPINYWIESRDPERTPFQWNAEKNAGFSSADKTWLPVAEGYETLNVEVQKAAQTSHLNVYKALAQLRTEPAFRHGRYDSVALNSDVFAFERWHEGVSYVTVINFKDKTYNLDLTYFEHVAEQLEVVIQSVHSPKNTGDIMDAENIQIEAHEALVLKVVQ
ncbi:putative maltase H [Papilio xuthus]|uniref:alpha-glucosidase n=1 Tax=Papilio xuthus TaxID=66420 RepID=A0A194PPD0_PAPXU|nr:putative maltase H [Papilio xuthus]